MDEERYRQAEQQLWGSEGLEATERFVTLPSTGTAVRVLEVGEGDPVLFLHGSPNAASTFVPLLPGLAGRRVLLVDRPGCGLSAPHRLDAASLPGFADRFAVEVLDGLGIERADVVGSSLGGYLALRAAAAHPRRFRSMVQLGCPALVPAMGMPPMIRVIASPLRHLLFRLPANERAATSTLSAIGHGASIDRGRVPTALLRWYVDLQAHTDTFRHDGDLMAALASPWRGFDRTLALDGATLEAVSHPTLLVWGADDAFGGPEVATWTRDALPDAHLVVLPDSGHLPWFDDVEHVSQLVEDHLEAHATAPA